MRKKLIPVLTVIILIVLVLLAGVLTAVIKGRMPSNKVMDSAEYFGNPQADEMVLIVNNTVLKDKGKVIDGRTYLSEATIGTYINSRFYWDSNEKRMIYTLPTETIEFVPDSKEYTEGGGTVQVEYEIAKVEGDTFYLALEFVQKFTDMQCTEYHNPNRVVILTEDAKRQEAEVKDNGKVRKKGGIKSPILTEVSEGQSVIVLEELENWSKVAAQGGFVGYIEKDKLSSPQPATWATTIEPIEYTSIQKDYKINLAWHQVTSKEANASLEEMIAKAQGINTISPTWFSIKDEEGNISSLASKSYVEKAHAAGLEVWGLISNFSPDVKTYNVLSFTEKRARIIKQLIKKAKKVGMDGINLDFETINEETAPHYVQFIRELSIACRKEQLVLSIDNPVPQPYNMFYNRKEQGIVADYVIIMGYDEHYGDSEEAGSVASLGFVKDGIEATLAEVPANKVINGIPFYTRVWIQPYGSSNITSEVLGMNGADNYVKEHNMETYWDGNAGQDVATLDGDDALYQIWMENEKSIEEKMKLIKENNLAGVAEWKLGFERESIWEVIRKYLD